MLGSVVTLLTLAVPLADSPVGPPAPRLDREGFSLPDGAVARLGRYDRRLRADGDWAAFADDGKTVARLMDGYLRLFELSSGRDVTPGYLKDFRSAQIAFLPDGRHLILSPADRRCFVADPATGDPLVTLDVDDGRLAFADATPDGKRVLVRFYNSGDICCVAAFDLTGRTPTKKLFRGQSYRDTWALAPDGARLFHAWERGVEVIDVATGDVIGGQPFRGRNPSEIAVAGDGKSIVTATERGLGLFAVTADGLSEPTILDSESPPPFALSEDGQTLFNFTRGRLNVTTGGWNPGTDHDRSNLRSTRFSRYGKLAIDFFSDRPPVVWEPATGKTVFRFLEYGTVREVVFGPKGAVIVRHDDRVVREWEADGRNMAERTGRRTATGVEVNGVSRDGHTLLESAGTPRRFYLTDAASEVITAVWPETMPGPARLDPTGRFAVVSSGKTAALHDLVTGRRLRDVPASPTTDFSADGRLLATAALGEVRVTELASGKERAALKIPATDFDAADDQFRRYRSFSESDESPQLPAGRFHFSADGRTLALFTFTGRVTVWSLTDGSLLYREGTMGRTTRQAALRPDGKWIAYTLRTTRRLALRDITESRADRNVVFLPTCPSAVSTLAFTPDGKHLISGHEDGLCLVWDVDELIARRPTIPAPEPPADPWEALGDADAKAAARAADELVANPSVTVRFLERALKPDAKPNAAEVKKQVEQLGDADFATRERAEKQLRRWRELVAPELKAAAAEAKEPEVQERLQRLVMAVDGPDTDPERLRALRAVEVLERIGTPEAKRLLTRLSGGVAESLITVEAKLAVERLAVRGR